jgi:hypothetical protein
LQARRSGDAVQDRALLGFGLVVFACATGCLIAASLIEVVSAYRGFETSMTAP